MAIDMSKFSPHVQAAIRAIDLPADALKRAEAGRDWLDQNAPLDWRLQMISIHNGHISSNVRTCRNDENALALALRRVPEFKGCDGRVTWATLMKLPAMMSRYEAEQRGFIEKSHRVGDTFIDEMVDSTFLDAAWEQVLGNYQTSWQPVQVYAITPWPRNHLHSWQNRKRVA